MNKIQKIGHRGAKGYIAENTLTSFQKALDMGVDGIELDVHLSADGQIMVIHDDTIDRTTSKKGFVSDYTSLELTSLGIPTLMEIIELVNKKSFINIEIKDPKATQPVLQLIENCISKKNWKPNLFLISSFDWSVLQLCHSEARGISLGVLTEDDLTSAFKFAQKINAYSIHPYFKLLNPSIVSDLHQNRFKIYTWTVNSEEDITFVRKLEVDGIISDFPDRI